MYKNLNEVLAYRAFSTPNKTVFYFRNEQEEEIQITYAEFDQKVKFISNQLQAISTPGDRVLLLYPPSIDFIIAFFACLDAGIIAVPSYIPSKRRIHKLEGIIADADIRLALCADNVLKLMDNMKIKGLLPIKVSAVNFISINTDKIEHSRSFNTSINVASNDLAFLQYTSGSTSFPKGVMLTHHNLLSNLECMKKAVNLEASNHLVSWLPPFHDMGLIGILIETIYSGASATLISPIAFIKKPARWLNAISNKRKYRRIISGGPNFAFDLCVDKISPDQLAEGFDLSAWEIAFSGAEPIRNKTLKRFYQTYQQYGFRQQALQPLYGLAEATLMVTSGNKNAVPIVKHYDLNQIETADKAIVVSTPNNRSKAYVACGKAVENHIVKVVNKNSNIPCSDQEIGEIWVKGNSVAKGYWNNKALSKKMFNAYTSTGEGPFLRTGDMGFLAEEELFITGRIKDMIIINGRNHYPEDIELTSVAVDKSLRKGATAAFSIEYQDKEKLIIVQELEKEYIQTFDSATIVSAIKKEIILKHNLVVDGIVLVLPSAIPKTTSGKIQRFKTKANFLQNSLKKCYEWSSYKKEHVEIN